MKDMKEYSLFKFAARGGGIANDTVGSALYGPISVFGQGLGLASGPPTKEELEDMDKTPFMSYVPGVGGYRAVRKQLATHKGQKATKRVGFDILGNITAPLLLAVAGGLTGAVAGAVMTDAGHNRKDNALHGALVGANLGSMAAIYAGGLAGIIGMSRRRRTAKEQEEVDNKPVSLSSLLVPGVASYNLARRIPRIQAEEDARNLDYERRGM